MISSPTRRNSWFIADLSLGEVESAASSARLFANVAARKKMRNTQRPD